ncbi:c-type cytochrome biogenesis protein CcmI [Azospirillum sp. ST 5-10]|uniref:c-type cytochrome biogenesis protein CcmI n=1 Tax=unclassified Azospirillum TaxID=2630922 RepID=UPI003F4A7E48
MLFWIVAAAMTAGVVLLIVPPLLKPRPVAGPRAAYDLEVYRDQLAELERERARGLISDAQAAAAKAEIGRRMLAVAGEGKGAPAAPAAVPARSKVLAVLLAVLIPLGALAVYLPLGHPDVPAMPLASRDLQREQGGPPPQVLAAIDKLKEHLAANPDDRAGWDLLGRTYAKMGRYADAAQALGRAAALAPGDLDLKAAWAEALTNANGGIVPEPAQEAFAAVAAADPKEPRARFYLALARFQAGDVPGALQRWQALAADTPADAPWLPAIQAQIRQAAGRLGLDADAAVPQPAPPAAPQTVDGAVDDPQIRGMVQSLADRLRDDPSDVAGWKRLARSYSVLGEHDKAVEAGKQAVERAPGDAEALLAYADALLARAPQGENGGMPAEAAAVLRQVLQIAPDNADALWLLGLDAAMSGRKDEASELWNRLLASMDPKDPNRDILRQRIDALKQGG